MAKQIYIDENGNEQLVSGTINNAELLPIDALHPNDNTKDYIDSGLSGKQNTITVEKDVYPITTYGGSITCLKYGKTVTIIVTSFGQTQAPATGSAYTLGTIASKYRPDVNLRVVGYCNYTGYKYDGVQAYAVNADGTIVTYNYGNPAITSGNFTVTFVKE